MQRFANLSKLEIQKEQRYQRDPYTEYQRVSRMVRDVRTQSRMRVVLVGPLLKVSGDWVD